jgi:hypothetical protein
LAGATGDLDFKEYLLANNWDGYSKETIVSEDPFITTKTYFRYPSNQPELTLEDLVVNENGSVSASFSGSDRNEYENPIHEVIEDKTGTCRGPTNLFDKIYEWKLYNSGDDIIQSGEETTQTLNLDFFNLAPGNYRLGVTLQDDTFWKDDYNDSGINESQTEVQFTIDGELETIVLQPGFEDGKDSYIRIEEICDADWNCPEYHKNINYGQEENLKASTRIYSIRHWDAGITFIQFDFSNIPENSPIENATLELYGIVSDTGYTGCGSALLSCYPIIGAWSEDTVNWNNGENKISSELINQISAYYDPELQPRWVSFDITGQVQNWINGVNTNYGLAIHGEGTGCHVSGLENIPSSEYTADPTLRPKLTIQYLE